MEQTTRMLNLLSEDFWHSTSEDNYRQILRTGFILPEPGACESIQWPKSIGGACSYVKKLKGVS